MFFLLINGMKSHSQVFKAGNNLGMYVDIVPDSTIRFIAGDTANSESCSFDINGDLIGDFQLIASFSNAMASGGTHCYISFKPQVLPQI
jgi:hypothetical protein